MLLRATQALDGVGLPDEQKVDWSRVCVHILRPITNGEFERLDMFTSCRVIQALCDLAKGASDE